MIHNHLIVVYLSFPINPKHINLDVLPFYDDCIIKYLDILFRFSYLFEDKTENTNEKRKYFAKNQFQYKEKRRRRRNRSLTETVVCFFTVIDGKKKKRRREQILLP